MLYFFCWILDGLAVPISMDLYICLESILCILVLKYSAISIANSVLPLAVGPIKIITWGGYADIWISVEKNISYIIKVIKLFIDLEPLSYCGGKFNKRPFKNNILKV